jgi:hypothetical protein
VIILKTKWEDVRKKLSLIAAWARNGLSEKQMAHNLGIAYSTFREYKANYPALSAVLAKNKEVADIQVENALYKRATGFSNTEIKKVTNPDGSIIITETTKQIPPDTVAASFWLKNRKPKDWRDKQFIDQNVDMVYKVIVPDILKSEEYSE